MSNRSKGKLILVSQTETTKANLWKLGFLSQGLKVFDIPPQPNEIEDIIYNLNFDLVLLDMNSRSFNPYLFCRKTAIALPHLPIILTSQKERKIYEVEHRWAVSQGAKAVIPNLSQTPEVTGALREVFHLLGWYGLYNEKRAVNVVRKLKSVAPTNIQNPNRSNNVNFKFMSSCEEELIEIVGPIGSFMCRRILSANPGIEPKEFLKTLIAQIPKEELALKFKHRLMSRGIIRPKAVRRSHFTTSATQTRYPTFV